MGGSLEKKTIIFIPGVDSEGSLLYIEPFKAVLFHI
jgi:hypothetical protein